MKFDWGKIWRPCRPSRSTASSITALGSSSPSNTFHLSSSSLAWLPFSWNNLFLWPKIVLFKNNKNVDRLGDVRKMRPNNIAFSQYSPLASGKSLLEVVGPWVMRFCGPMDECYGCPLLQSSSKLPRLSVKLNVEDYFWGTNWRIPCWQ